MTYVGIILVTLIIAMSTEWYLEKVFTPTLLIFVSFLRQIRR